MHKRNQLMEATNSSLEPIQRGSFKRSTGNIVPRANLCLQAENNANLNNISIQIKTKCIIFTPVSFTPVNYTPVNFTPVNFTPVSFTPVCFTPVSFTPIRFAPVSFTIVSFTPVSFGYTAVYADHTLLIN